MSGFELEGLDELERELKRLADNARKLDGEHQVSFSDLFPDRFMRSRTDFRSIGEMLNASGFSVESAEDFDAIPDDQWDGFINQRTQFSSWDEMLEAASTEWAKGKLGL